MNTTPMRLRHNADEDPPEAFLLQAHLVDVHAILHKQVPRFPVFSFTFDKIYPEYHELTFLGMTEKGERRAE
jgi:hypothetical protein